MQLIKNSSVLLLMCIGLFSFNMDNNSTDFCEDDSMVSTLIRVCKIRAAFPASSNNSCPINGLKVKIDNNCNARLLADLTLINLAENPVLNQSYPLLPGMPDIYVEYGFKTGFKTTVGPITELTYKGNSFYDKVGNIYPLFEHTEELNFDVAEYCPAGGPPNALFSAEIRVVELSGGFYPIDDFKDYYEAIYCDVFEETCCPQGCTSMEPLYDVSVCGKCEGCEYQGLRIDKFDNFSPTVSPNPFSNEIFVGLQASRNDINIQLMDMTGKVILSKTFTNNGADQNVTIDTHDLPQGIYIAQIQSGERVSTQQIMKSR